MTLVTSRPAPSRAASGNGFAPGGEFSVGAEEELLLVGADNLLAAGGTADLLATLGPRATGLGTVMPEVFGAEIEFASVVCRDADQVWTRLHRLRAALASAGGRAMAVGVHPAGAFGDATLTDAPRYRAIGASLGGLLRTPTAALQVHVGMPDAATAVTAYRGLRHHLPVLRALTAASPYWHGQDSGLASARWAVVGSYPRSGVPPAVSSWDEYAALTASVLAAAEAPDHTYLWWDLRLQPRLGTIEVRVMDAQPSLAVAAGLVALVQGLARAAVERPVLVEMPAPVLAENDFRAARYGLNARLADSDGMLRPARKLAAGLVAQARAALGTDGLDGPLDAIIRLLVAETEPERQRRLHQQHGMPALLDDLVLRTLT
ncbi:MAG: YbdK family carboxylate-amine ligase [Nocardioidaceae bacterium]|nr:YbdK family carboxylate-amine ligase [Nocardioidaceae bacterium]